MLVIYRCLTRLMVTRSCSTSARIYQCTDYRIPMHGVPQAIVLFYWLLLHMHVGFSILVVWIPVHATCMIVPCYGIHVIWLFHVADMDILVTGLESCWYAICGIPHLVFPLYCSSDIVSVSRYLVPVILFYTINRAQVQLSCYPYHVFVLVTLYTWHIR